MDPELACEITEGAEGGNCEGNYEVGSTVVLTANPAEGSTFAGWTGDVDDCAAGTTCSIEVTAADRSVIATFEVIAAGALTISGAGSGSGTVSTQAGLTPALSCQITEGTAEGGADCSASYAEGSAVVLIAEPAEGSTFEGWGGAAEECGTGDTCSVVAPSEDFSVVATFNPISVAGTWHVEMVYTDQPCTESFDMTLGTGTAFDGTFTADTLVCEGEPPDTTVFDPGVIVNGTITGNSVQFDQGNEDFRFVGMVDGATMSGDFVFQDEQFAGVGTWSATLEGTAGAVGRSIEAHRNPRPKRPRGTR